MNSPTRVPMRVVVACAGLTAGLLVMPGARVDAQAAGQAGQGGAAAAPATAPVINTNIPAIPSTLKAGNPGPADVTQINQYITAHIGNILSADAAAMKQSREALINGAYNSAQPMASPAYQAAYTTALGKAVQGALAQTKDVRAQLNLAVVVARVADQAPMTQLDKAVLTLIAQQQPVAIKLWGLKAARPILPELARMKQADPLIQQVLAVAKQHADDGAIASEAYEALTPDQQMPPPQVRLKYSPAELSQFVDPLLALSRLRIDQYKNGVPPEASSDGRPFDFLSKSGIWDKALNQKQQQQAMQQLCDLVSLAAARFDQVNNDRSLREQLQPTINTSVGALVVMAMITDAGNPNAGAKQLANAANVALGVTRSGNPPPLVPVVAPLCPAISQVVGFENVKAPAPPGPMPVGPASKPAGQQGPAGPAIAPAGGAGGAAGAGAGAGVN